MVQNAGWGFVLDVNAGRSSSVRLVINLCVGWTSSGNKLA